MLPRCMLTALFGLQALASPTAGSEQGSKHGNPCISSNEVVDGVTWADERHFRDLSFHWSIAWDRKNESTWLAITGPSVIADYTDYPAVGTLRVASPGDLFKGSFAVTGLGDKRLHTQHLLGNSQFTRVNATEAKGDWQVRARHVRTLSNGTVAQWDSSAFVEFIYQKINGEWKIGGIRPHTVVSETGRPQDVVGKF